MFILEHHRVSFTRHALNGKKENTWFSFSQHRTATKRHEKEFQSTGHFALS